MPSALQRAATARSCFFGRHSVVDRSHLITSFSARRSRWAVVVAGGERWCAPRRLAHARVDRCAARGLRLCARAEKSFPRVTKGPSGRDSDRPLSRARSQGREERRPGASDLRGAATIYALVRFAHDAAPFPPAPRPCRASVTYGGQPRSSPRRDGTGPPRAGPALKIGARRSWPCSRPRCSVPPRGARGSRRSRPLHHAGADARALPPGLVAGGSLQFDRARLPGSAP